jgi:hypothetical protein
MVGSLPFTLYNNSTGPDSISTTPQQTGITYIPSEYIPVFQTNHRTLIETTNVYIFNRSPRGF